MPCNYSAAVCIHGRSLGCDGFIGAFFFRCQGKKPLGSAAMALQEQNHYRVCGNGDNVH